MNRKTTNIYKNESEEKSKLKSINQRTKEFENYIWKNEEKNERMTEKMIERMRKVKEKN